MRFLRSENFGGKLESIILIFVFSILHFPMLSLSENDQKDRRTTRGEVSGDDGTLDVATYFVDGEPSQWDIEVPAKSTYYDRIRASLRDRLLLNLDYAVFTANGSSGKIDPGFALSFSVGVDLKEVNGTLYMRFVPGAPFAVGAARNESVESIVSSRQFQDHVLLTTQQAVSQIFGLPLPLVQNPRLLSEDARLLVEGAVEGGLKQVRGRAELAARAHVERSVNFEAGVKTGVQEIEWDQRIGGRVRISFGKSYGKQMHGMIPHSSNLIWGANPNVTVTFDGRHAVFSGLVYTDRGSYEGFGGYQEGYVRAILKAGDPFFRIKLDSWEFNLEPKAETLEKLGLAMVKYLVTGFGNRQGHVYGYVRVDTTHFTNKISTQTLWSFQSTPWNGVNTKGTHNTRVMPKGKLALGVNLYSSQGNRETSFTSASSFLEVPLPKGVVPGTDWRPSIHAQYGIQRGPLVRQTTGNISSEFYSLGLNLIPGGPLGRGPSRKK